MGDTPLARLKPKPRGKTIPVLRYGRDRPKYAAGPSVIIAMVPVMAISRAVRPMAMVTRVDAECPVHSADRAAHRAAGDSTKWTGGGIAFRRAALHSSNNALSMNRDRCGEQSRNRGKLQNFQHFDLQGYTVETTSIFLGLT
jgi:hypothetical protein